MSDKPIVIDLFCGAGGESQGIHWAMGDDIKLYAVNHWQVACDTHAVNFPSDETICQDIQTVIPTNLVKHNEEVELMWASPECTHFSTARGGKPMDDQSRCTPFDIIRWLTMIRVKRLIIENVPEFETWGPLDENCRPVADQKGLYFSMFVSDLRTMGYVVDWRILNAADYGAPTTRRRFFLQAVKQGSGKRIMWPDATHSVAPENNLFDKTQPWIPVRECIDWSIPKSPLSAKQRKLADATIEKICAGIQKFWSGDVCEPFLARYNGGVNRVHSINQPCPVLDCSNRYGLVEPILMGFYGNATYTPVSRPCPTLTCKERFGLIEPILQKHGVVDISLRMLTPEELKKIQSFPNEYQFTGNRADVVRQIGNAVCPKVAEALVAGGNG